MPREINSGVEEGVGRLSLDDFFGPDYKPGDVDPGSLEAVQHFETADAMTETFGENYAEKFEDFKRSLTLKESLLIQGLAKRTAARRGDQLPEIEVRTLFEICLDRPHLESIMNVIALDMGGHRGEEWVQEWKPVLHSILQKIDTIFYNGPSSRHWTKN